MRNTQATNAKDETMNATATTLRDAIDRSVSHNEIVAVEWEGDCFSLVNELNGLYCGEIGSVKVDDKYEFWGGPLGTEKMDWRLHVTLTARDAESAEFNPAAYGRQSTPDAQSRGAGRSW